jgi:hypothetical protein
MKSPAVPKVQAVYSKAGCCNIFCGVMMLMVGCAGLAIYLVLTPVYKPITCDINVGLDGVRIPSVWPPPWEEQNGVQNLLQTLTGHSQSDVQLHLNLLCSNPNPISVHIDKAIGVVYAGTDKIRIGTVTALPTSSMPAYSNGSIQTKDQIPVDPAITIKIMPELILETGVPIWFQVNGTATISPPFFPGLSASPSIRISCGMHLSTVRNIITQSNEPLTGPMSCADTMDDIDMKPVGAPEDRTFDKILALAESIKNVICITMMLLGFVCGFFLLSRSGRSWCFCHRRQQARDVTATKTDARKVDVLAQSEAAPGGGDDIQEV